MIALDNCEICRGSKGGVPGNENIINGQVVCDYCTVLAASPTNRKNGMQLGTNEEIQAQQLKVHAAENALVVANLRLRALKGEALLQPGDSVSVFELQEELAALQNEFGGRNLRMM